MVQDEATARDRRSGTSSLRRRSLLSEFLLQDFMPHWRQHIDRAKSPLGLLLAATLTSLISGWFVGVQGYLMFAMCSGVVAFGIVWPTICMRGLRCEQWWASARVVEGTSSEIVLRVSNRWPWPVWGVELRGLGLQPSLAIGRIPSRSQREYRWEFVAPLRGRYPRQPLQIATRFPFGVWEGTASVSSANPLLVWPRPERRPLDAPPTDRRAGSAAISRNVGADGDVNGVRTYRLGDRLRDVHWSQTARLSTLMVKDRQTPPLAHIRIILDLNPRHHRGEGAESSLEQCVRVAAGLVQHYMECDERVQLVLGRQQISGRGRGAALTQMMDSLSLVTLPTADGNVSPLIAAHEGASYLVTTAFAGPVSRNPSVRVVVA